MWQDTKIWLMFIFAVCAVSAGAQFAGGTGTSTNPWQIATAEHLNNVRNYLGSTHANKYFIQTADINLGVAPWNEGSGWNPIGPDPTYASTIFWGSYDGNGHVVSGLFINRPNQDNVSLFGCVKGYLRDLTLEAVNVTGRDRVAGLVSWTYGSEVVNCSVVGSVVGINLVAGIAATSSSTIQQCTNLASIEGNNYVGGVVGLQHMGWISRSVNHAFISGNDCVGGLSGQMAANAGAYGCYSTGPVTGNAYVGGLIGYAESYVANCYSKSPVSGTQHVGGFIGKVKGSTGSTPVSIVNSYSIGSVPSNSSGFIGSYEQWLVFQDNYWDMDTSGAPYGTGASGRTTDEMTYPYAANTYQNWDFTNEWMADQNMINGGYPVLLQTIVINQIPSPPVHPHPPNQTDRIVPGVRLSWSYNVTYDFSNYPSGSKIWVGTDNPPTNIVSGQSIGNQCYYDLSLALNATYYWMIVPFNSLGDAEECPVWTFTTHEAPVLSYPNGGELWHSGTTRTIRWNDNAPPQAKLWVSYNNGSQWNLIAEVDGARGFYHYQVPSSNSAQCLIKLSSFYDEGLYDISNAVFTISTSSTQPKVVLTSPSAGGIYLGVGQQVSVSWTRQNVSSVGLDLSTDDGDTWNQIASGINANSYLWTVPDYPGSLCRIRVRSLVNDQVLDISDNAFSISRIELLSPNGGELITSDYSGQSVFPITWSSANMGNVKIEYSTNGGSNWETVNASIQAGSGSYNWAVPGMPTTMAKIRISNVDNNSIADVSETSFTVRNPIRLVTANGGGFVTNNSLFDIRWVMQDIASSSTVHWEWSTNGNGWTRINSTAVAVSDLSMAWFVETGNSPTVWLRAVESGSNRIVGKSEQPFTVTDKMLSIIEPNGGESYQALSSQTILWDHFGLATVNISFSPNDGANWTIVATNIPANNGAYVWQVPDAPSAACRIRLQDSNYAYMNLESQQPFIVLPVIVLPPVVEFVADVLEGDVPLAVQFTETVEPGVGNIVSRVWDFGDGSGSDQQNPQHVYTTAGTYTVSLTVTNSYGGESTETKAGYIRALPNTPRIELLSPSSLGFGTVYLGDTSASQTIRIRNFGTAILNLDPVSFFNPNPSFTLVSPALPAEVAIGDTLDLEIVFMPANPGAVSDTLYINSDASNDPVLPVRLTGLGQIVPPAMVEEVVVTVSGHDALISWQPVTETIYGTPVTPEFYIVLHSENPFSDEDEFIYLNYTNGLNVTHHGVARFRDRMFYKVVAVKIYRAEELNVLEILQDDSKRRSWSELKGLLLIAR